MSIQISMWDFFAYTVPGAFYLFVAAFSGVQFGLLHLDRTVVDDLSLFGAVIFAGAAYIVGMIIDPLAKPWHYLFRPKDLAAVTFEKFKKSYPEFTVKFDGAHWPLLLAYLRNKTGQPAVDIERHNVTNIMLRNISFGLLILAVVQTAHFFVVSHAYQDVITAIAAALLAILAGRQAAKFAKWFYLANFEAVVGLSLKENDLIVGYHPSTDIQAIKAVDSQQKAAAAIAPQGPKNEYKAGRSIK